MTRYELERFLARTGAHSLASYLGVDAHGDRAMQALDKRIEWAARAYRDEEHREEAEFLLTYASELRAVLDEGETAWRRRMATHDPFAPTPTDPSWRIPPAYQTPQAAPVRRAEASDAPAPPGEPEEPPAPDTATDAPPAPDAATDAPPAPGPAAQDPPPRSDLPPDPGAITGAHRVEDWTHIPEFDGDRAEDVLALFGPAPEGPPAPAPAPEPPEPPPGQGLLRRIAPALLAAGGVVLLLLLGAGVITALATTDLLPTPLVEATP